MKETEERKILIVESKKRCKKMGMDPDVRYIKNSLSEIELARRQKYCEHLIESALPYMKLCSEIFKLCDSVLVLTDNEGYVIKAAGPTTILESRKKMGLGEGVSLREEHAGTNAVALTIKHRKPMYVEGKEYYLKIFRQGACFCAPIMHNNTMLGTVVIVYPKKRGHPHTFALIQTLAKLIEQEYSKLSDFKFFLNLLNIINLTVVATDVNGQVFWLSERAGNILDIRQGENISKDFGDDILRKQEINNEIVRSERLNMDFWILKKECNGKYLFLMEQAKNPAGARHLTCLHSAPYTFDDIVGLNRIKNRAKRIAVQDTNLLIIGESGTGKELLASAIHNASPRAGGRFVVVNCAAIPETLFESELFGYKKGAFTDARYNKQGKIEYANKGTLFFDEIAELPLDVQAKLLRVLEDRKVFPLGSNEGKIVDVRFIFATNQNLEQLVKQEKFRKDLYYRICSPAIKIPPLRERKYEIPALILHLIRKIRKTHKGFVTGLTNKARECLVNYEFPGNVRELEGILRQAFLNCKKEYIDVEDLGIKPSKLTSIEERVKCYKARLVYEQFITNDKDVKKTCRQLNMSRAQLYRYINFFNNNPE